MNHSHQKQTVIMETTTAFEIRPYSKRRLAAFYYPYLSTPASAVARLRAELTLCRPLMNELLATGYRPRNRYFSARQVRIIVSHLGEP
ncbi:MAG: DUF4248 domain-containing protein [Clostridium sp.]|nr:DUF4248 domain-containing protein [Clostridium sp.]